MSLLIIIIIYSRTKEACESADHCYIQPLAKEACECTDYNYYIQSPPPLAKEACESTDYNYMQSCKEACEYISL